MWHRFISKFPLPVDLPFNTPPTALPADELQRLAIKAIRLDENWRRSKTRVRGLCPLIDDKSGQYVEQMQFSPGGKWLWTAQRILKRESWNTRMSLWALEDVENPHRVWSTEIAGIFRSCTVMQHPHGDSAAASLVVGVCENRE